MQIAELLVKEFDAEMATTRHVLERVPDDKADWKPHPKSFSMAHLAQLVSMMPSWAGLMIDKPELDIAPEGATSPYQNQPIKDLLAAFDANAAAARAAIGGVSNETFNEPWTLKSAGRVVQTESRYYMMRTSLFNHMVHHRAQLGLYLRLVDVPVPSMYGPTADEKV